MSSKDEVEPTPRVVMRLLCGGGGAGTPQRAVTLPLAFRQKQQASLSWPPHHEITVASEEDIIAVQLC